MEDLRRAIDCLPRHTRVAMLEGIEANEIIVGAYATSDGVCPMLAAHRAGGRTAAISFARAWDRVAFRDGRSVRVPARHRARAADPALAPRGQPARRRARPRRRSGRPGASTSSCSPRRPAEPASRAGADAGAGGAAERRGPRPGDPNRAPELRSRRGWAWTRIVRRHDDYERSSPTSTSCTEAETGAETEAQLVG